MAPLDHDGGASLSPQSGLVAARHRCSPSWMLRTALSLSLALVCCYALLAANALVAEKRRLAVSDDNLAHLEALFNTLQHTRLEPGSAEIPIVMYVRNRPDVLAEVVSALREVEGVGNTMLIISHDGFDPAVFNVASTVEFCRVRQLIHRQSLQPNPVYTVKAHWWWLVSILWEHVLPVSFDGDVVFLEEDHKPTKDFYRTLQALCKIKNGHSSSGIALKGELPLADILGVAMHSTTADLYDAFSNSGHAADFFGFDARFGMSNTGYSLNRSMWNRIKYAKEEFLMFGEGWDWSVHMLQRLGKLPRSVLIPQISRIANIGSGGVRLRLPLFFENGLGRIPTVDSPGPSEDVEASRLEACRLAEMYRKSGQLDQAAEHTKLCSGEAPLKVAMKFTDSDYLAIDTNVELTVAGKHGSAKVGLQILGIPPAEQRLPTVPGFSRSMTLRQSDSTLLGPVNPWSHSGRSGGLL